MLTCRRMRATHLLAAVTGALVAALGGGIAWAAIPGDGGTIHGCYTKVGGVVRVIDLAKGQQCHAALENPITWNQKGPKGEQGPTGPQGQPGADGRSGADGVSPAVTQLAAGDPNCPAGGAAITDARGATAYVCSGANGTDGQPFAGTFRSPNGEYAITVDDSGITLARGTDTALLLSGSNVTILGQGAVQVTAGRGLTLTAGEGVALASGSGMTLNSGRSLVIETSQNLAARAGTTIAVESGTSTTMVSGASFALQTATGLSANIGATMTVQSGGPATIQSGSGLSLAGSQVLLNNGSSCAPAARAGDTVVGGAIAAGSATVCIG